MTEQPGRLGRVPRVALITGTVWAVALVVAGFVAPVYDSAGVSSSGAATHTTKTLVEVNGAAVVVVLAVPLLLTLLVAGLLRLRSHRWALVLAWSLTGLLAVFNLLAMLSIGAFVVPVTLSLMVACFSSAPTATSVAAVPR